MPPESILTGGPCLAILGKDSMKRELIVSSKLFAVCSPIRIRYRTMMCYARHCDSLRIAAPMTTSVVRYSCREEGSAT